MTRTDRPGRNRTVAVAQLVIAVLAAVGGVFSWLSARSVEVVAPIIAGEPEQTSAVYDPGLIALALLLATVTGVAVVLATSRLRRDRGRSFDG